ncbi:MAG: crossover junction endodeoxyribonuclease RuvC [Candidatus Peribacteraceae bacterium]|nr:crossover junction endodeoxyribonuclease RuvC [Candidatus Peribacteraceae bacterium]
MIIAGIDYSMTSPGIAIYDTSKELNYENVYFHGFSSTKKHPGRKDMNMTVHRLPKIWKSDESRYRWIASAVISILNGKGVGIAAVEGLSMGSRSGMMLNVAQNQGELRQQLEKQAIEFILLAPTSVKKHFQGKGNATKQQMIDKFIEKTGVSLGKKVGTTKYGGPVSDLVDAYAIVSQLYDLHIKRRIV